MEVSRRQVLKGSAAAGVAVAGLACVPQAAKADEPVWDEEYDVVVVGSGTGLAGAIEAFDAGARVIVLEKGGHAGGKTCAAGGGCGLGGNNPVQQREGIEDDNDAWFEEEMRASDYRAQPSVVRALVDDGAGTVEFMMNLGMDFTIDTQRAPAFFSAARCMQVAPLDDEYGTRSGLTWVKVMKRGCEERGIEIRLNNRMTKIIRDGIDGPVMGVEVETPEGVKNIKAKRGVVLATGNWSTGRDLLNIYDPRIVDEDYYGCGYVSALDEYLVDDCGDGHKAAAAIGAILTDMDIAGFYNIVAAGRDYFRWGLPPYNWDTDQSKGAGRGISLGAKGYARTILVKNDGRRYVDEGLGAANGQFAGNIAENQELPFNQAFLAVAHPRRIWAVADSAAAEELGWDMEKIQNPDGIANGVYPDDVVIANTLEELAAGMGIDAEWLVDEVARYNGFVAAGVDEDFGKANMTGTIEVPPFYGLRMNLIVHTCQNGVMVNSKMQVLDGRAPMVEDYESRTVIPHLYCGSETANIEPRRRLHWSLGHFVTSCRIAGRNAAAEPAWDE
ncbi:MAG: FAD-dependent oxidoreductase [Coriobacteriales bacterium]|nr:FAD-dependent oxidoreductase [Coriobacteriales bacterium]